MVGFNYEIRLVRDGKYGSRERNGTWNGMVGELTRQVCLYRLVFCRVVSGYV